MKEEITIDDIASAVKIVKDSGYSPGISLIYPVHNILTNVFIIHETKYDKPLIISEEDMYRLESILELEDKKIYDLTLTELKEYILAIKI